MEVGRVSLRFTLELYIRQPSPLSWLIIRRKRLPEIQTTDCSLPLCALAGVRLTFSPVPPRTPLSKFPLRWPRGSPCPSGRPVSVSPAAGDPEPPTLERGRAPGSQLIPPLRWAADVSVHGWWLKSD